MKTMRILFVMALLAVTGSVSAQFANSSSTASSTSATKSVDTNGWQKVYVSYTPTKFITDVTGTDDTSLTGFTFGYAKGFSIAKDLPVFIEAGINATYAFNSDLDEESNFIGNYTGDDFDTKMTYLAVSVPVNLMYKVPLKENISLTPFIGLNLKGNIIGKTKVSYNGDNEYYEEDDDTETNFFDKKDVSDKDNRWKRVQLGWQIGVGLNYNQVYVGLSYSKDLSELCKKVKISTYSITLGYNF